MLPIPRRRFNEGGVHVVLVEAYFYLDWGRLFGESAAAQVVEKGQDADGEPQGIGEFQDGVSIGRLAGQEGVELTEQINGGDVVVEGHDGKCRSEEA